MKKDLIKNILIGFLAGTVSGFFGAGGGMILVPFLTKFSKQDEVRARATTILCIFFMALTSSFFYFKKDNIDWMVTLKCIAGGIVGGYIGSKLLVNLSKNTLRIFFIVLLIYTGVKMIFQ